MNKFAKERNNSEASKYIVNEQVRAETLLVITDDGENLGVLSRSRALAAAQEASLDLVQVGEKDNMVVAKIMDFGKFLYAKKKQMSDSKKHQKVVQIKEIKMRPNIGDQDYRTKLNQAVEFFAEGKKVKFTLQFKGREITMMDDLGFKFFARITNDLSQRDVGALVEEKDSRAGSFWSKIYFVRH